MNFVFSYQTEHLCGFIVTLFRSIFYLNMKKIVSLQFYFLKKIVNMNKLMMKKLKS
jgi:hypothetical protein